MRAVNMSLVTLKVPPSGKNLSYLPLAQRKGSLSLLQIDVLTADLGR